MSFSEDPSSPAAPFSGDSTGQIFDLPDMVAGSVTTDERVVDTQSGFLIVVKRFSDRLALSVKRRIGTPPSSSVALTPDESIKLSRILSTSIPEEPVSMETPRSIRRRNSARLNRDFAALEDDSDEAVVAPKSLVSAQVPMKIMLGSVTRAFMVPIVGIALTVFAVGFGFGVGSDKLFLANANSAGKGVIDPLAGDPLNSQKVDTFVRQFVSRMLDFSSKTYRLSQVQAMASMTPELMERYWQETKFPLTRRQLAALPEEAKITITDLKQERVDQNTVNVDLKAVLGDPEDAKQNTSVNLRLKLSSTPEHQIIVTDQQDTSTK